MSPSFCSGRPTTAAPRGCATIATRHAATTARDFIRVDGSTWQLVYYDDATGAVKLKTTSAGYDAGSMWARGQAWAILGFAAAYRETREDVFLQAARRVTDRSSRTCPPTWCRTRDFRDPAIPAAPRDSSAAAIAASGMLDLARSEPDEANGARYAAAARATLASLMSPAYFSSGANPAGCCTVHSWRAGTTDRGLATGTLFLGRCCDCGCRRRGRPSTLLERAPAPEARGTPSTGSPAPSGSRRRVARARPGQDAGVGALRLAFSHGQRSARLRVVTSTDRRHWRQAVTTIPAAAAGETFGFASRQARYGREWMGRRPAAPSRRGSGSLRLAVKVAGRGSLRRPGRRGDGPLKRTRRGARAPARRSQVAGP